MLAADTGLKGRDSRISLETEQDQGVTTRVLDLLAAQQRFPTTFALERRDATLRISLGVPSAGRPAEELLDLLRSVPGVRRASADPEFA